MALGPTRAMLPLPHSPDTAPAAATVTTRTPDPDSELAARAAGGDTQAFARIMRRHNRLLFRTARSILRSDADAEEALQEGYLRAWRALERFRGDARLSTWLVRIVANEALSRLRQRGGAAVIPLHGGIDDDSGAAPPEAAMADEPDQRPERMALRGELRRLIEAGIDELPEAFRSVFMLRAVEEMSVEEVAQALAIPEATVRTRHFRARALLREALAREVDVALGDAFSFDGARCDRIVAGVLRRLG